MSLDRDLYKNLIASLFPSIHGNNEVKRGILLMLFGGVGKNTIEGNFTILCCILTKCKVLRPRAAPVSKLSSR